MFKKYRIMAMGSMVFMMFSAGLRAETVLDIKLLVFEGARYSGPSREPVVTASYLRPTISANIPTDFDLEEVKKQIKRVFNLSDVSLLTEAELQWRSGAEVRGDRIFRLKGGEGQGHFFRLNGHEYYLAVRPGEDWREKREFRIDVTERTGGESGEKKNVLSSSFSLPGGNIAVFGFESEDGRPYFLSVHITRTSHPSEERSVRPRDDFIQDAVRAMGEIDPPRLIKRVDPVYPKEARKHMRQGTVILACRTGLNGAVEAVEVLRGGDPLLDQAAIDAVRQWKYEPFLFDGRPRKVAFTITVRFKLK